MLVAGGKMRPEKGSEKRVPCVDRSDIIEDLSEDFSFFILGIFRIESGGSALSRPEGAGCRNNPGNSKTGDVAGKIDIGSGRITASQAGDIDPVQDGVIMRRPREMIGIRDAGTDGVSA